MMSARKLNTQAAALRAKLNHPVIDADGHVTEIMPVIRDHLRELAGPQMVERFAKEGANGRHWAGWTTMTPEQRRDGRTPAAGWWGTSPSTLDRATASLARLQAERMDDLGID